MVMVMVMIFSNQKIQDLPFVPKICKYEISRVYTNKFFGVIINHNLNWNDHILAIKAKMSRYVGILFKLNFFTTICSEKYIL